MNTDYDWAKLYRRALLETDWTRIEGHIEAAERGLRARLSEFSLNHGGTPDENQAIANALNGLKVLRHDVARSRHSKRMG